RFDAMHHAVADQLHQRAGDGFDDVAVNLGGRAGRQEIDLLVLFLGNHARGQLEPGENLADGHQPQMGNVVLDVAGQFILRFGQSVHVQQQVVQVVADGGDV